jgi:hypothetical protein
MQTVTALAQAMADTIAAAVPAIDSVDLNSYLPAVDAQWVALIGVPTGSASDMRPLTLQGNEWEAVHRVRLQLWVKFDQGDADACMERARDVGFLALQALAANDGDGYSVAMEEERPLRCEVAPDILSVGDVPYLVVTLTATVWETGAV